MCYNARMALTDFTTEISRHNREFAELVAQAKDPGGSFWYKVLNNSTFLSPEEKARRIGNIRVSAYATMLKHYPDRLTPTQTEQYKQAWFRSKLSQ